MVQKCKKIVAAVAVATLMGFAGHAQTTAAGDSKNLRFGIGASIGVPTDNGYNISYGADLRLQKDFTSNVSGMLTAGFTAFSLDQPVSGSVNFVPVKLGVKVFPVERFYISGEAGAAFGSGTYNSGTYFVYAPGIGLGTNSGLDLGLRYEGFSRDGGNIGHVALRVAYGFNLSK